MNPSKVLLVLVLLAGLRAAQAKDPEWLARWNRENRQWRALHLIGPQPAKMPVTHKLVADVLAPMGINVLILEVNYGYDFKSHPELQCRGLTRQQARELAAVCRRHNVRLIPLFNCLGHQSWAAGTGALLKKYPEFDETPHVPADNKGIYCREWCPSHPEVNRVVFGLLDELVEAFDADAVHVGMDEVFLIGDAKCPRCRGKDPGDLMAKVVNELHGHLVKGKGVEMLLWADRLLDAGKFPYGRWEASATGSHRAIGRVPKDVILCDWHYEPRKAYPSVQFFQEQGFRVLPATWKNPEAGVALIRASREKATEKMLGMLFTGWSIGGNGEELMAALKIEAASPGSKRTARQADTARQVAATIQAGMKEIERLSPKKPSGKGSEGESAR